MPTAQAAKAALILAACVVPLGCSEAQEWCSSNGFTYPCGGAVAVWSGGVTTSDDRELLRVSPTPQPDCVVTVSVHDGKPQLDLGPDCIRESGSLHAKPGAALIFRRAQ